MNGTPDSSSPHELPIPPAKLLEEAPTGWLVTDADGIIRFVNQHAIEMFGFEREELLGRPIELLVPSPPRPSDLEQAAALSGGAPMPPLTLGEEFIARGKDGTEFPIEVTLSPVETASGLYMTAVMRDISERVELEEERNNLRVELEMELERDRIGMDLHDGIMQEIYAAGLTLELALADVKERPDAAEAEIERSIDQLHEVIRNIRSYIFDLRPRQFTGTLGSALAELAREFRQNTQIEVAGEVPEELPGVTSSGATAAYHIVHEALSNVRKHSGASRVQLAVYEDGSHVVIEVEDNGEGFDTSRRVSQIHRGMRNMNVRARNAGCDLDVHSTAGEGTRIVIRVPVAVETA